MMVYHLPVVPEHFKGPLHFLHHGFQGLLNCLRPFLVEGTFSIKIENHGSKYCSLIVCFWNVLMFGYFSMY